MAKAATRNDVARLAGVSPAVVSYVLNNSNYVSDEKREAVLNAVETLSYRPNLLARGLKTNKSSHFGFICDNIQNELFADVENLLYERGYYVSLCYSRPTDDFIQMLMSRQFEGIFMTSNLFSAAQLNTVAENGIPMVFYQTRNYVNLNPRIVTVAPDYYDTVRKSVDYLVLKGHRRIGLIPPVKYKTNGVHGDDYRVRAYVESLEKNGIPVDESLVCKTTQTVETIFESIFNMLVGDESKRPTAFVVGNDYLAAELIQYLKKFNLHVPQDIALIGSDDTDYAKITSPTLTTVAFSRKELAASVVDKLIRLAEGEKPEGEFINVRLVIRESA